MGEKTTSVSVKFIVILIALGILFCIDAGLGSVSLSALDIFKNIFNESNAEVHTILWLFRFPKALTCVLAGATLAASGLLMQTLFRNPLAGPDVLGLSSGASLAVGVLLLAIKGLHLSMSDWSLALAAGAGSTVVLLSMIAIARTVRDNASLLIIGLMLAAATSSAMSVMQFVSRPEELQAYIIWTMGSVSNTGWNEVVWMAIIFFIGAGICVFLLKPLNGWLLGENYAQSLGINVSRARFWMVMATGLMVGGTTAFCGPIAFVGLATPHLLRLVMTTTNHKILLPAVMCGGAILLLFCDAVSQLMGNIQSLPLNALTSLVGAPIVIWQVMKFKKISV